MFCGAVGGTTLALAATGAPAALADQCSANKVSSSNPGNSLFDSQGYEFDINQGSNSGADRNDPFATLLDGGQNGPTGTPPGVRSNSDSWDSWGALFVGPGGDADIANYYFSTDDNSCTREDNGREIVFPEVTINGLVVQRKIFVSSSGLPGGRLLELVRNPGGSPVTTSVQVGDTFSSDDSGDLGSDDETQVRFDSSGNNALDNADLWAVTSDSGGGGYDDALAHVFDGQGGADHIDFATLLDGNDPVGNQNDNLAYRWDNVTIAPGETAAFLSYEIQQEDPNGVSANTYPAARDQAQAYEQLPFDQIYAGMSPGEIAAVRNWPHPPQLTPLAPIPEQPPVQTAAAPPPRPARPHVAVAGVNLAACASRTLTVPIRVSVARGDKLKSVEVTLDGRTIRRTRRSRFNLRLNVRRLRSGRHRLGVTATGSASGSRTATRTFRRCAVRAVVRPRFTG
jgi:hypothetical protein